MSEEMHQAASKPKGSDSLTVKVAGALEKPCLGQPFQLGMLYDCRSDSLIPGVTLWGSEALSSAVSKKPFETSDFEVVTEDSLREKMFRLDVDPSLEISILSGMVHVQGAAKFLNDRQSSRRQARVSLKYKSTTRFEQLTMDQLGNFEYTDVFDKDIATHVVTGMVYGGDAFFVFDREVGVNEDFKKIYGYLQMKVEGLPGLQKKAIGEEGSIGINSGDMEEEGKLKCMFYGDVVLPKHPATFFDAVQIYQELPELFQGKSVPKKVWLYPLGKLGSKAQRMVCEISSRLVDEVHTLMESLHEMTMRSNDLMRSEVCSNFSGLKDELKNFKRLISSYRAHLEKSLAMLLPKVRGGGTDEAKIAEILQKNSQSPFSHQNLVTWISGKENEVKILAGYLRHLQQQGIIQLAFEPGAVDVIISDLDIESVLCFDFGITWGQDALLLKMESHLSSSHDVSQNNLSAQPWYRNQALLGEMRMQLRCFIGFAVANHSKEGTKFVATNSDSKNDAENRFVSLYECCNESKFEPPDKPSKLRALNISATGLQLNWGVPRYRASVQSYTVSYTDNESSDQWCTQTIPGAEQQQLVLSELVPGTAYCFKVRADTSAGFSPYSDVCKIQLPPDAPGRPQVSNVTHDSLELNWNKPKHGSETIQLYTVLYKSSASDVNDWTIHRPGTSCQQKEHATLSGLIPNTVYYFKVRAESAAGPSPESDLSDPIQTPSPISQPGRPCASEVTHNCISLKWDKPEQGADIVEHYTIIFQCSDDHSGSSWSTHQTSGPVETIKMTDLLSNAIYTFKVRAESAAGPSSDSELSDPIKTLLPISQPGKPRASMVTHNCAALQWDKPKQGADIVKQYTVLYRRSDDLEGAWITYKKAISQENANLTGLAPKQIYTFKVRAESAAGHSPESELSDPIETLTLISQPGKPCASNVSHNCVNLKWDKPERGAHNISNYTIFYKRAADHTVGWSSFTCKKSNPREIANVSKLDPKTAYVFKVRAESTAGPSPLSEPSEPIETLSLFSQPGKPRASNVTHNSVTLKWDKPERGANNVGQYIVFYISRRFLTDGTRKWSSFKAGNSRKNVTLSKLDPKTAYVFKVRADSAAGPNTDSDLSDPIETLSSISQPGKPNALKVTHNSITLMWDKPERGADMVKQYTVFFRGSVDDPNNWYTCKSSGSERCIVIYNLIPKTFYIFKVTAESTAVRASSDSEESASVDASPDSEVSDPIETLLPISQPGKPCASVVTHNCITLAWDKPEQCADIVEQYTIIYSSNHGSAANQLTYHVTKTSNPKELVDVKNLQPKTTYTFKVRAESGQGLVVSPESELSDPIETLSPISKPGKPFSTNVSHDSIALNWDEPEQGAQALNFYTIIYHPAEYPDNVTTCKVLRKPPNESTTLSKLDPKTVYFVKIRAETVAGSTSESDLSDPIETMLLPPGKPCASQITYKGFQVNWERPRYSGIQHYIVSYQATDDPPDVWDTTVTPDDTPNMYFPGAEEKLYVFKVSALTDVGTSSDSKLSDPIETKTVPYGAKICKGLSPLPNSNPPTYLVPTHCVMKKNDIVKVHVGANRHGKVKSGVHTNCSCHTRTQAGVRHKVLMVVGATGAGKTTLINGIANYILGVQWDDDFRYKLIPEPALQDQSKSQTTCITAYTFYKEKGSPLPYTLTVIDTPGFGDTAGLTRDKQIVQQIKELFSIAGDEGIDVLHGIGFVTQAPLARLTLAQQYVFDAILSVFGKDVADNIFLMITFADGMQPPVLDAVKAAKVPYQAFFKFNNSALFASKSADDEFDRMFWKMGTKSFHEFFDKFSDAQTQSLQLSREVIQEREALETTIQGLQPQIKAGLAKIDELRQERQILKDHEADILTNKDFTYKVEVTKQRKIDLPRGTYTTNCLTCNYTCHDDCIYADDADKYNCSAMGPGRGTKNAECEVCPEKCSWKMHKNNPYRFELYQDYQTRTSDALKKRYVSAMSSKEQLEGVIEDMKKELDGLNMAVFRKLEQARRSIERLQEIALKPNYLTEVEYIDLLIESEKREAKPRWLDRVKALEGVRQQAVIVSELMKSPKARQQNVFSVEETAQDKSIWKKIFGFLY